MSKPFASTLPRFRFGPPVEMASPLAEPVAESSFAMKLLVVFLLLMYSSIGALVPAVEAVRPAMTVAIGALLFTFIEVTKRRSGFRMSWPEGTMLMLMLGVSILSMFGAIYLRQAAETTLNFTKVVLIYIVIENIVTTRQRLKSIMLTMVVGGLIPAFGTIRNYASGHLIEGSRAAFAGTFGNPNEAAYGFVILVPLALAVLMRGNWFLRLLMLGSLAVFLLAIYLTFSRGGLLGLFGVVLLFGWKQKSIVVKGALIALLAGGIVVVSMFWTRKDDFSEIRTDTTVNQRIATIKAGLMMFRDNPLLGVGPGCSLVAYPLYVPKEAHCGCQDQLVVHNAYVQVLSELGAFGFVPFVVLIGAAIFHAWRLQRFENPELQTYAMGLELALWGFAVCGISGGFSWSWFPYLLTGLVVAARQIVNAK